MTDRPRPQTFSAADLPTTRAQQLQELIDDVRAYLDDVPTVFHREFTVGDAGVPVPEGMPLSVEVARVLDSTVSAAPYVDWAPNATGDGIVIKQVLGAAIGDMLLLRIEV